MTTETMVVPPAVDQNSSPEAERSLPTLIADHSAEVGHATYLERVLPGRDLTYRQLECAVAAWSDTFALEHVPKGAVVALAVAEPITFAMAYLSIIASGRWVAPLNPHEVAVHPSGVRQTLTRLGAVALIADGDIPHVDGVTALTPLTDVPQDFGSIALSAPRGMPGGALLSSSGTTGAPKLIPLSQRQLLATAKNVATHHQLTRHDRGFNPLPLFHINAEVVGLLATLMAGSTLILDDRFHRSGFWNVMGDKHVTWINAVPAIITLLSAVGPDEIVPPGVRFIRSASAPLPTSTLATFEAHTGIAVLETYGMTEAASQITANPLVGRRKPGSVGLPVGVELRIVPDSTGGAVTATATAGTTGHVEIRGPSVIRSYGGTLHHDRIDPDGWLRTGDLGHVDRDGYLFLDGRVDDVINRGGEKIFPGEIEEVLLAQPGVTAASVVGLPDRVLGQVPVAFVVLAGVRSTADAASAASLVQQLRSHVESTMVRHKCPVEFRIVSELPTGPTGKVQRRTLGELTTCVIYTLKQP